MTNGLHHAICAARLKWSDGHPFTADDILFYFEDIVFNKEYTTLPGIPWRTGDEYVQVENWTITPFASLSHSAALL